MKLEERQIATLRSLKKIDDRIFTLEYSADYHLDEVLSDAPKNIVQLLKRIKRRCKLSKSKIRFQGAGCTTFISQNKDGDRLLSRNFDYKDAPVILVHTHPEHGYESISCCDANMMLFGYKKRRMENTKLGMLLYAPYVAMDGMNSEGLSIAVLEVKTKATHQKTGKPTITTTLMIRHILDHCKNVDEAVEEFNKYDMRDSLFCNYHYHLLDASGKSVIVEYINNKIEVIKGSTDSNEVFGKYSLNFFFSEGGDNKKGVGYTREKYIKAAYEQSGGMMEKDECMDLLDKCRLHYRHKRLKHMVTSLWSVVYDVTNSTLLLCAGMDYEHRYDVSFLEGISISEHVR